MDWSSRYSTPLSVVFSRQHKLELEWKVELALLKALGEVGRIPVAAHDAIKKILDCGLSSAGRVDIFADCLKGRAPTTANTMQSHRCYSLHIL